MAGLDDVGQPFWNPHLALAEKKYLKFFKALCNAFVNAIELTTREKSIYLACKIEIWLLTISAFSLPKQNKDLRFKSTTLF